MPNDQGQPDLGVNFFWRGEGRLMTSAKREPILESGAEPPVRYRVKSSWGFRGRSPPEAESFFTLKCEFLTLKLYNLF